MAFPLRLLTALRLSSYRRLVRCLAGLALLPILLLFASAVYVYWDYHRPLPPAVHRDLFQGITYTREVRHAPRPIVLHVVSIDLDAPGIHFLVTPGQPTGEYHLRARTTSQFLGEFKTQVAINAAFFHPWHANGPLDYYPHVGDPVSVDGLAMSQGQTYAEAEPGFNTLFLTPDNRVTIGRPSAKVVNAVSGRQILVRQGKVPQIDDSFAEPFELHPRTAAAVDASGKKLILFVVDGRQPNYSEGVTLAELAQIVLEHGGDTALNLDGGGSSTLVVEGPDGWPEVLNSPIHGRIPPGRERPVANHLGVFARR
jgi:hypothetical protein